MTVELVGYIEMKNSELSVKRYCKSMEKDWDNFVRLAKNSLFMFQRNYMDYHSDRFEDYSMMFYRNGKLVAVMPANIKQNTVYSHGGLTYGGLIVGNDIRQNVVNDVIGTLIQYLRENHIKNIYYKIIPYIYHKQPSEEDKYALFQHGARLSEVAAATVINLNNPLKMSHGRIENINKATRNKVNIKECFAKKDFDNYIELLNKVLETRHGVNAVHTSDEMFLLYERFPQNIHLICAFQYDTMIAGAIVYEYEEIIHTQYLAADEIARKNGGLDLVIAYLIRKYQGHKKWLDFGISTEDGGRYLNEGLIAQKEGFGGRTVVCELWELEI